MAGKISLSPVFCLVLAGMLLTLPLPWVGAMLVAAAVHEGGHWLALLLCGRSPKTLRIGTQGARMPLPQLSRKQELLCAWAGPVAGLFLLTLYPRFPRLAFCGGVQSLYNLLPIYPLDGGRALHCLLQMLLPPPVARKVVTWAENLCLAGILAAAIYAGVVLDMGILPILMGIFLLFRAKSGKMPCKAPGKQVQYPYSNFEV